jgi:hypothetical protein
MARAVMIAAAALCAGGSGVGCASTGGEAESSGADAMCLGATEQRLIRGASSESYLGLAEPQIRAVVEIVDRTQPTTGALCTGAFIAADWVVTAAHCLAIASPEVLVAGSGSAIETSYAVLRSVAHPDRDVALLNVDFSAQDASGGAAGGLQPLVASSPGRMALAVGDSAEMAGFGLTEEGDTRTLRFLVETVTAMDDGSITVNGFGLNGACEGDSGGPLLLRDPRGPVMVAGVLSVGSADCVGEDEYIRLDAIADWLSATVGAGAADQAECGSLSAQGRCLYGSAMRCSGTQLLAEPCTGGLRCGWDPASEGFRCVDPSTDPCSGVDSVGACVENAVMTCTNGVLTRADCGCDACRIDGKTGAPRCGSSR